jgi:hypothetical protein
MYLKGWTQMDIARHMNVTQMTISRDLKRVEDEWREATVVEFGRARDRELRKLELIEREAWHAWQRSQDPASAAVITDGKAGQQSRKSLKHQYGDPRFLDQVNKCITQRCVLMGLQPAVPQEGNSDDSVSVQIRRERVFQLFTEFSECSGSGKPGAGPGDDQPGGLCAGDERGEVAGGAAPAVARPDAAGGA